MTALTRKQRIALKKIWTKDTIGPDNRNMKTMQTYRDFRRTAHFMIGGQGCILVPWRNMFLGIETDGHIHS
jgi:hypothetical protein